MPAQPQSAEAVECRRPSIDAGWLTVSLIVPVHNGGAAFVRCMESVRAADPAPDEVIVVLDGSTDGSADVAQRAGAKVLRTPAQSGPAAARNLGAHVARSEILFFVDADVAIGRGAVGQVILTFREHPELAGLIGSYDDAPMASNFLSQYKNLCHHYVHQHARSAASTFWGACGAVRREVFLPLGGFDKAYRRPSIEDIELGYRMTAAGHRIRLCKDLQVKHLKRWGAFSLFCSDFFDRALPWTALIVRSGRFENDLNLHWSNRAKVILVYGLLFLLGLFVWWPSSGIVAVVPVAALLALDAPLLRFLHTKRGFRFACRAVPWQWFHYFYSGLAFAIGLVQQPLHRHSRPPQGSKNARVNSPRNHGEAA